MTGNGSLLFAMLFSNILRHGFPFTFIHKERFITISGELMISCLTEVYDVTCNIFPLELGAQNIGASCGSFRVPIELMGKI